MRKVAASASYRAPSGRRILCEMRIIAGEHRGRRIDAPRGEKTRPMLDRVREALFSTVQDWIPNARALDLFAGSGSLGLEALSRGAEHARFVERAQPALAVLRQNVEALGLGSASKIVRGNALSSEAWSEEGDPGFDLVFFDPPYAMLDDAAQRKSIVDAVEALLRSRVRERGVLVFHAPARALETLRFAPERTRDVRTYGTSALCYLFRDKREAPDTARDRTPPPTRAVKREPIDGSPETSHSAKHEPPDHSSDATRATNRESSDGSSEAT
jgi:16S rRNA (guanine(966)-N(2))-methyltransferase RsmD